MSRKLKKSKITNDSVATVDDNLRLAVKEIEEPGKEGYLQKEGSFIKYETVSFQQLEHTGTRSKLFGAKKDFQKDYGNWKKRYVMVKEKKNVLF